MEYYKKNPTCETEILSIDRIGRSTLDILQTSEFFKKGTLAERERAIIRERCKGGIEIAKSNGIYLGRKKGPVDDQNRTLQKHNDILACLNSKMKIADICRLTGKHRNTIYKVKSLI